MKQYSVRLSLYFVTHCTPDIYLATYSNLENHPRLIRARQAKSVPKIELDPKTGLPLVDGKKYSVKGKQIVTIEEEEEEEDDDRCKFRLHLFQRRR